MNAVATAAQWQRMREEWRANPRLRMGVVAGRGNPGGLLALVRLDWSGARCTSIPATHDELHKMRVLAGQDQG